MKRRPPFNTLIFLACGLAAPAWGETVRFDGAAVSPTPLQIRLAHERGTEAVTRPGDPISAELYRPAGRGPFPAVIALHGCGGRPPSASEAAIAASFTDHGILVLAVDSFGPRGIHDQCSGAVTAAADRVMDAYGALDWLVSQPFAIPSRVALVGFSQGANVGLAIASSNDYVSRTGMAQFAAAILYYPFCQSVGAVFRMPTLILVGALDDWTPAKECTAMMAHNTGGSPARLNIYPDAQHSFNILRDRPTTTYGHHLAYDEAADHAASNAATAFLAEWMK